MTFFLSFHSLRFSFLYFFIIIGVFILAAWDAADGSCKRRDWKDSLSDSANCWELFVGSFVVLEGHGGDGGKGWDCLNTTALVLSAGMGMVIA
jgi:hypothetical protein